MKTRVPSRSGPRARYNAGPPSPSSLRIVSCRAKKEKCHEQFADLRDARPGLRQRRRKLRQDGIDDSGAIFGRADFASISKGFGLRGSNVTDPRQFAALLRDYEAHNSAEIWNIPISDQVTSPTMRRIKIKGHGVI
jgi:hypothetical protein